MDLTPTALFESYEQDFQHVIQSIREKVEGAGKDQKGGKAEELISFVLTLSHSEVEQRKAALRKVEIELDEADDIVRKWLGITSIG